MDPRSIQEEGLNNFVPNPFEKIPYEVHNCIQNCLQCAYVCEQLIGHCLKKGGAHARVDHIRRLQDCSDICQLSAKFMVRGSEFDENLCTLCTEACLVCAEDCEQMADDQAMEYCAEVCRRCAESCEQMSFETH